ncbi:MAG: glycoside hydrolase family 38 C-terminal domain-containing protein, partial [Chloroflexota bacterium]
MESVQQSQPKMTIHLITHNHWDREWIFTAKYANRWLPTFFDNLFAMLEAQPEYRFVLDGQTLIIEDYLRQLAPDEAAAKERDIRRFAQSGQLQIGPAYLQPDWSLVSGESLVRNLLIGGKMAQKYGPVMKAGWLLDNFGQVAQAPQIFKGFNIEGAFVWRGIDMPMDNVKTEFWWEAPDGSRILGIYLLDSYRNAMMLNMTREIAEERILSHTQTLRHFAATPNVLLMNGYEQVPEPDDILPILAELNAKILPDMRAVQSTPPDYLQAVRQHNPELPVLTGYQYNGRFAPILKGVYSSRSYLNQQNNHCQRELERWAEKFNTFAWAFGHDYPEKRFERAWKTLLLNHTHDDLCGCCIDPIARDMADRFDEVTHLAQTMSSESLQAIVQTMHTAGQSETAVVIFNPSSRPRRETTALSLEIPETLTTFHIQDRQGRVMPMQLIKRIGSKADLYLWTTEGIPSVGYRTYYVVDGAQRPADHPTVQASAAANTMENQYLHVRINTNGTLTVREKIHDDLYENLGYFEDGGDAGDTYDYSYPLEDKVITSLGETAVITLEEAGPLIARFRIDLTLKLPRSLTPERTARAEKTRKVHIVSHVELAANAGHVEIRTTVNNVVKDHRLRVLFPSHIHTDHVYAGMPFDVARYPLAEQAEPDNISEALQSLMLAGRYKAPVNTRPFQNFISLADDSSSLTVFSRGLNELEVLPEHNTIALTLLRGVGWLTRADLLTRDGDVGPHIFTPEAQCLGEQVFEYSIYPHGGDLRQANPHFESDRHTLKFRAVQTDAHNGRLPDEFSFLGWLSEEPEGALKLTAVKQSEEGSSVIVRLYNALDIPAQGALRLGGQVLEAWRTDMAENNLEALTVTNNAIPVQVSGKEIVTLKVEFQPRKLIEDFQRHPAMIVPSPQPVFHFPTDKMPPLITQEEVAREQTRAMQLEAALQAIRSEAYILNEEIERRAKPDLHQLVLLQHLKGREATLARQHYEARISALLNHQLLVTWQMEKELDEIGASLNWARVRKRVGEFLSH